jgi:hypothetical protein
VTESAEPEGDVGRASPHVLAGNLAALDDGVDESLPDDEDGSERGHEILLKSLVLPA